MSVETQAPRPFDVHSLVNDPQQFLFLANNQIAVNREQAYGFVGTERKEFSLIQMAIINTLGDNLDAYVCSPDLSQAVYGDESYPNLQALAAHTYILRQKFGPKWNSPDDGVLRSARSKGYVLLSSLQFIEPRVEPQIHTFASGIIKVDIANAVATVYDEEVSLRPLEHKLLELLVLYMPGVVKTDEVLKLTTRRHPTPATGKYAARTLVSSLRGKLAAAGLGEDVYKAILTIHGIGYQAVRELAQKNNLSTE